MFRQTRVLQAARWFLVAAGAFALAPVVLSQTPAKGMASASLAPVPGAGLRGGTAVSSTPNTSPGIAAGVVSGVVLDPSGGVIVGAHVALQAASGKVHKSATTNRRGEFQFSEMAPGDYQIEVRRSRFQTWRRKIVLKGGSHVLLRVEMQLAPLNQHLTVSESNGRLSASASENADVVTLDQQSLGSLPIQGNDVVGAITKIMGPALQAGGDVQVLVDGLPLSSVELPASQITEVRINKDPYSALYSSPGQKRIEIRTKTGSRHLHGSAHVQYRGSALNARNAFATRRPFERHVYFGGAISGPIGNGKKTSFSADAERYIDDIQATVYAQVPSGTVSENYPTPYRGTFVSGVVTHKVKENNTMSLRYSYYATSYDGKNVGGLDLPEAAANYDSRNHYFTLSDQAVLTGNLLNQLSLRLVSSDDSTQSALSGRPGIVVLGAFTGGGAQQSLHQTSNYVQLADILSWSHGNNLVKAGVNVPTITRWGLDDRSNFDGTFQFSSLQDYEKGKPFSFVQNQGNGRLVFWQKEFGLFAQDEIRLRPNFSVAFGLRFDWQNYMPNWKNFAPRISFAYAPGGSGKTVLRGGAGIFYQMTGSGAIMDMLRYNGRTLRQYVISNPGYPDPLAPGSAAQALPSSIVQFSPTLRLPYILQYSLALERKLTRSTTLTVKYTGLRGFDQFLSRDINAPLLSNYTERPNPAIAMLRQIESSGRMERNAVELSLYSSMGRFFSGEMEYTFARCFDNTDGIGWFPANQYSMAGEWGRCKHDMRNSFSLYGTVTVKKWFRFGTILSARSGLPYTETVGTDIYGTSFSNARPPGISRNSLQGPGALSLDAHLARDFSVGGRKGHGDPTLSFAVDAFNVLNHVNYGQPVGVLTSPLFGTSVSSARARRLQLSLGFKF